MPPAWCTRGPRSRSARLPRTRSPRVSQVPSVGRREEPFDPAPDLVDDDAERGDLAQERLQVLRPARLAEAIPRSRAALVKRRRWRDILRSKSSRDAVKPRERRKWTS